MDKLPVGQLPDLASSNNDDEIMVITDSEHNQLKKEKISDFITDLTSTDENNAIVKGTDGKMFVTDFGNASNITEGTLPASVLPDIPKDKLPEIEITDLPESGVTANTYAYPASVTVNAQGQVTAIEAGEPGANNANQDLSNISEAGKEVIRETAGSDYHLTQNQITNCILEAPNGVVEWSGVSLTGSLVNNQGVVSGFSETNYAVIPGIFGSEPWELVTKIHTNNDFSIMQDCMGVPTQLASGVGTHSKFSLSIDFSNGAWANNPEGIYTVLPNTDYWIKINYTGTQYTLAYSLTGEDNSFVTDITINNSTALELSNFRLGYYDTTNYYWRGSIDLSQSYIKINGKMWWQGNDLGFNQFRVKQGLKTLFPNGRNSNNTLQNTTFTAASNITGTMSGSTAGTFVVFVTPEPSLIFANNINYFMTSTEPTALNDTTSQGVWYNPVLNTLSQCSATASTPSWSTFEGAICATLTYDGSTITAFNPIYPVELLKRSDKEEITGWGIPDYNKSISLTSSAFPFTAPYPCAVYIEAAVVDGALYVLVNKKSLFYMQKSGTSHTGVGFTVMADTGDIVSYKLTGQQSAFASAIYYPLKGGVN